MKKVLIKIALSIGALFIYGLINQEPKGISGIVLTILLLVAFIVIWTSKPSKN